MLFLQSISLTTENTSYVLAGAAAVAGVVKSKQVAVDAITNVRGQANGNHVKYAYQSNYEYK